MSFDDLVDDHITSIVQDRADAAADMDADGGETLVGAGQYHMAPIVDDDNAGFLEFEGPGDTIRGESMPGMQDVMEDNTDYARGFNDGKNGRSRDQNASDAYQAGYRAGVARSSVQGCVGSVAMPHYLRIRGDNRGEAVQSRYIRGSSACLRGLDILGAIPQLGSPMGKKMVVNKQPVGFAVKKTPAGKPIIAQVVKPGKPLDHARSIASAKQVAQRAQSVSSKLDKAIKAGGAKQIVGHPWLTIVGVGGRRMVVPKMSASQMKKLSSDLTTAAKKLSKSADTHQTFVSKATSSQKAGLQKAKNAYNPSGTKGTQVVVGGFVLGAGSDWVDVEDDWVTLIGAELLGAGTPDPANPGNYTDGTPDTVDQLVPDSTGNMVPNPNYGAQSTSTSSTTMPGGTVTPGAASDGTPGPPNYGMGSPPSLSGGVITMSDGTSWPVAGIDFVADPFGGDPSQDAQVYSTDLGNIPAGAVYYDPSVMGPMPYQGWGSFHRFFPQKDQSDGKGNSGFQWGGGDPSIMDGVYWWYHGATAGTEYKHENAGNSLADGYSGAQDLATRENESVKQGWGPLIGNPQGWTRGLRIDRSKNAFFWYWDQAPQAAQMSGPNGLQAKLNQAILDYNTQLTAAKANYAAAIATDQLNAKQAAAMQVQQQQEDAQAQHQAEIAQMQAQAQEPALEQQQAQLALQQEQQRLAYQKQQQQFAAQQQQAEVQAYQQFLSQPMPAGAPSDGGGGAPDQGGDQGGGAAPGPFDDVQEQIPAYDPNFQDDGGGGSDQSEQPAFDDLNNPGPQDVLGHMGALDDMSKREIEAALGRRRGSGF